MSAATDGTDGSLFPAPGLTHAFTIIAAVGAPLELGLVDGVRRRIIPILGGEVRGPRLRAAILPGGADWQTIRPDGVVDLLARYTLRAEGGTLISVTNPGYRRGPPEILARLAA